MHVKVSDGALWWSLCTLPTPSATPRGCATRIICWGVQVSETPVVLLGVGTLNVLRSTNSSSDRSGVGSAHTSPA